MITLALDTTGDRAAVAVQVPGVPPREAFVDGARRHAGALLPLATELLAACSATLGEVQRVVLADGPGSFTGLRVGATVAKAIVLANRSEMWAASTLAARAWLHRPAGAGDVAVLTSALRGECFAGRYRLGEGAKMETLLAPCVLAQPAVAATILGCAVVVADLPGEATGTAGLEVSPGSLIIGRPASSPRAMPLLELLSVAGGAMRLDRPDDWEPMYGRPAEAQARWELAHGRTLPHSPGRSE